jgi:hypothetical protein
VARTKIPRPAPSTWSGPERIYVIFDGAMVAPRPLHMPPLFWKCRSALAGRHHLTFSIELFHSCNVGRGAVCVSSWSFGHAHEQTKPRERNCIVEHSCVPPVHVDRPSLLRHGHCRAVTTDRPISPCGTHRREQGPNTIVLLRRRGRSANKKTIIHP